MTTSPRRRRRSTIIAVAITAVVLVLAGVVTAVGASTLANSREGRDASADAPPELSFPVTPTALLGVIDGTGRLTSAAILALQPDGTGGSIVSIAPTGDSTLGIGPDRLPLAETYATQGAQAFVHEVEGMTTLAFDVVEIVDEARLATILSRLGDLEVDLPAEVRDDDTDAPVAAAGEQTLTPDQAAAVLAAHRAGRAGRELDPARDAVWSAVADAIGPGIGSAEAVADGDAVPIPDDLDAFVDRLYAGETGWRNLSYRVPEPAENPRAVDTVVPDRAEIILVFSQISPGRVGAPNPSHAFRIESGFGDADLEPLGINTADLDRELINRLLFVQANVVSVVSTEEDPPAVTRAYVAEDANTALVEEIYPQLVGELEVLPAEVRIEGVDVVLVPGRSYLDFLASQAEASVSTETTESTDVPTTDPTATTAEDGGS